MIAVPIENFSYRLYKNDYFNFENGIIIRSIYFSGVPFDNVSDVFQSYAMILGIFFLHFKTIQLNSEDKIPYVKSCKRIVRQSNARCERSGI